MRNFMLAFAAMVSLFLSACGTGGDDSGTATGGTGTGGGFAEISGSVRIDGTEVVCQTAVFTTSMDYVCDHFTDDNSTCRVEAGKTYLVCAGNPEITDSLGRPLHTEGDGTTWRDDCVEVTLSDGDVANPVFDLDRYFHLVDVECSSDAYRWISNAWQPDGSSVIGTRTIEVLDGSRVIADDLINEGGVLDTRLITAGAHFALLDATDDLYLEDEVITGQGFVTSLVINEFSKETVTCE